jgi:hypothetical protein
MPGALSLRVLQAAPFIAGDVRLLPLVLAAAEEFSGERPSDERMDELVRRHSLRPLFV